MVRGRTNAHLDALRLEFFGSEGRLLGVLQAANRRHATDAIRAAHKSRALRDWTQCRVFRKEARTWIAHVTVKRKA